MNRPCHSLDEVVASLLRTIEQDRKAFPEEGAEYFFRGETCNHAHPGSPYLDTAFDSLVDREEGYWKNERKLYEEAMRLNVASFTEDRTMAERVARMQHYGLPTRFADLSENALLSVCFAAGGGGGDATSHEKEDGFIRVIKVAADKMKSFTSDIISAIAHLPLVSCEHIHPGRKEGIGYLTYEILRERPGFSGENEWPEIGETLRHDIQQVWAFKPIVNNPRLRNQGGVFLAFGCRDGKEPLRPSFSPADYGNKDAPSWGIMQIGFVRIPAGAKTVFTRITLVWDARGTNLSRVERCMQGFEETVQGENTMSENDLFWTKGIIDAIEVGMSKGSVRFRLAPVEAYLFDGEIGKHVLFVNGNAAQLVELEDSKNGKGGVWFILNEKHSTGPYSGKKGMVVNLLMAAKNARSCVRVGLVKREGDTPLPGGLDGAPPYVISKLQFI